MKKILFVTQALWIGGVETALVNLLSNFNYGKYDVTLLVLRAELDMLEQIPSQCRVMIADRERTYTFDESYRYSTLYHLQEESGNPSTFHRCMMWTIPIIRRLENSLFVRYIRRQMRKEKFDTAVIYSDVVAETTIRAINAKKYLMFYHHGAMRHVYHDSIAYKKCEKIIAVSESQAEELRRFVPEAKDKIVAIHNLTNPTLIRAKADMPIPEVFDKRYFHVVTVGRVSHEKGMDLAVKSCAELVRSGHEQLRWWIVGDGPAMPEIQKLILDLGIGKYIILTGMKENPYPYIKKADLYVQPSRIEGYPMTVLEALILGQPVISTNNQGAKEIIKENVTGRLSSISSEKITRIIEYYLTRGDELRIMSDYLQKMDFEEQNDRCMTSVLQLL